MENLRNSKYIILCTLFTVRKSVFTMQRNMYIVNQQKCLMLVMSAAFYRTGKSTRGTLLWPVDLAARCDGMFAISYCDLYILLHTYNGLQLDHSFEGEHVLVLDIQS